MHGNNTPHFFKFDLCFWTLQFVLDFFLLFYDALFLVWCHPVFWCAMQCMTLCYVCCVRLCPLNSAALDAVLHHRCLLYVACSKLVVSSIPHSTVVLRAIPISHCLLSNQHDMSWVSCPAIPCHTIPCRAISFPHCLLSNQLVTMWDSVNHMLHILYKFPTHCYWADNDDWWWCW